MYLAIGRGAVATDCTTVSAAACTVSQSCLDHGQTCGDQALCVDPMVSFTADAQSPDVAMDAAPDTTSMAQCNGYGMACSQAADRYTGLTCVENVCSTANACTITGLACSTNACCAGSSCATNDGSFAMCTPGTCGAFGTPCTSDSACCVGYACTGGVCGCPRGTTECAAVPGAPPSCTSLTDDPMNCGACAQACGTGASCIRGTCVCPGSEHLCGSTCTEPASDSAKCGSCGHVCIGGEYGSASSCVGSGTQTLCGSSCTNLTSDPATCGSCGRSCGTNVSCVAGICDCTGTMCSGVCVNLATDPNNCEFCGRRCRTGQTCTGRVCG